MLALSRYLLPVAAWLLCGSFVSHADTDRLRGYYEKLLESDPGNERARAFLGLPTRASELEQNEGSEEVQSAWKSLLEDGNDAAALSAWKEQWKVCSLRERPNLSAAALERFNVEMLPVILNEVLPAFAPASPARQSILYVTAGRLVLSDEAAAILQEWGDKAQSGDIQFARAAALLAARTGHPVVWAQMLQIEADAGGQPEALWEAWLAAGKNKRAAQAAADWFARSPDSSRALLAHLEMLLIEGNQETARSTLKEWLAAQPAASRLSLQQSLVSLSDRVGWRDGKEISLRIGIEVNPTDIQARLALLEFLFLWGDAGAAGELLRETPLVSLEPEEHLEFLEKTAELQRKAGLHGDAAQTAGRAFAKLVQIDADAATKARVLLLLVESLRLSGGNAEAVSLLAREISADKNVLPSEDLDRELFTLLSRPEAGGGNNGAAQEEKTSETMLTSLDLQGVVPVRRGLTREVRAMLESLQQNAGASGNEDPWLRLARWQEWTEDPGRAEATLQTALQKWPDSQRLLEGALQLARKLQNRESEMGILRELSEHDLDASRREAWLRELAFLEIRSEEGSVSNRGMLFLLEQAVRPDAKASARVDLALAYEMRDEWLAAWDAWLAAWQIAATDEMRADIRIGGERVATRLGRLEAWSDLTGRKLEDPAILSISHPGEMVVTESKLARTTAELRTLRARDPAAWLAEGQRLEAEQASPEEVIEFWTEAAKRFPRSAVVLKSAAEALRRENPGQAVLLLLQASEISPRSAAGALELARMLQETGDRTRAIDYYEEVLALESPPSQLQPSAIYPVNLTTDQRRSLTSMIFRLRSASGTWSGGWAALMQRPPASPPSLRVSALRALGAILSGTELTDDRKQAYLRELPVSETVEFLAALGDIPAALEILRVHTAKNPLDYPATLSFLRLAMASGLWGEALSFVEDSPGNTPERVDFFLAALGERILAGEQWKDFLHTGDAEAIVLPMNLRWPVAQLLAETGNRLHALHLAADAIPDLPLETRNPALEEVLNWSLLTGNLGAARSILNEGTMVATNLLEPDAALLRARLLLAPQADRTRWMDEQLRQEPHARNLSTASTRFLLAALGGYPLDEEASQLANELSNAIFGEGDRRMFVASLRAIVEKLLGWRLEEAASVLVSKALEGDEALRMLRGQIDEWQRGELQVLATAAALAQQPFHALPESVAAIRNLLGENRDFLPSVAALLAQSGDPARASRIFQILWEGGDRRPLILSSWWPLVRSAGDTENFAMLLEEFIQRGERVDGVENPHVLLVDLALARGDWDWAGSILGEAGGRGVGEPGLAERATAIQFLTGNFAGLREEHQPAWQKERNILSGEILARTAWLSGDRDVFFKLLWDIASLDPTVFLRVWDAALNDPALRPEDGLRLLSLAKEFKPQDRERLFSAAVAAEDSAMAGELLDDGWLPTSGNLQFILARPQAATEIAPLIIGKWKDIAEKNPGAKPDVSQWQAVDALAVAAAMDNPWQQVLSSMWKEGRGDRFAGEMLLRSLARAGNRDGLEASLPGFLKCNGNDALWPGLITMLNDAGFYDMALAALDSWEEAGIPDDQVFPAALRQATAFNRSGKREEARKVLEPWEKIALLEHGYSMSLANWMHEAGQFRQALQLHEEGMRSGPRQLRKAHAQGAARAAAALDEDLMAAEYQREADAIPGT